MVASGKVRLKRFSIGMSAGCGSALIAALTLGPLVAMAIGLIAFLASVFVADDGAGTFFTLALLAVMAVVLVLAVFVGVVVINAP
ncbi:hypothetical protein [Aurantiacibacter sediminis]|uniref:Uncharacterized protein n=1 Tax=Aurantiacibacter sediminis TaxID=2793064 RepID=A0ABS0N6K6_9SPHN|nr:hypothetical protein [Aurantiacibacter sediminis]MBH5323402.1 hypothetical protein [Aurantiacibacter sediminis]